MLTVGREETRLTELRLLTDDGTKPAAEPTRAKATNKRMVLEMLFALTQKCNQPSVVSRL